ncbi:MAG: DotA/TraY family protein [Desulfovibrionaceae bacterium]|nr:DotA/TraY family protein [Desulfovibrionaceae bacterium]
MSFDSAQSLLLSQDAPSSTDLSQAVLTGIFGTSWWDLTHGDASGIFSVIAVLNAMCAAVIAWIVIVRLLSAPINAAAGEKSAAINPWVPMRLAFAMAAITPAVNGVCAAHILILHLVGVSITMANSMIDTVLEILTAKSTLTPFGTESDTYSSASNTLDTGESITGLGRNGGKTLALQVLTTEAFLIYLNTHLGCSTPTKDFANALIQSEDPESGDLILRFLPPGPLLCDKGTVTRSPEVYGGFIVRKNDENSIRIPVPPAERVPILQKLISDVEASGAPAHLAHLENTTASLIEDRARVLAAGTSYAASLAKLVGGRGQRDDLQSRLDAFTAASRTRGWFALGAQYWTYITLEQELMARDGAPVSWIAPNYRSLADILPASFVTGFWPRINETAYMGDRPGNSVADTVLDAISPFTGLPKRFANALQESPDALVAMVKMARYVSGTCTAILLAAEAAKLATLGGTKLISKNIFGRIGDLLTGSGEAIDTTVSALVADVSFFLRLILLPLWCFATFVAYGVPAIPFLFWLAGIASWLYLVIEAIVAAPLWLIAHATGDGTGFAGSSAKRGYLLLLNLFLRPSLLVLALFLCIITIRATGNVIGSLAAPFIDAQAGFSAFTLGIVGCIAVFILLVTGTSLLTWKLFILIPKLPATVFRWIGESIPYTAPSDEMPALKSGTVTTGRASARTATRTISAKKQAFAGDRSL